MYQLITTKGRKTCNTIDAAAGWLAEMQPSSSRVVHGEIEAEIDEHLNPNGSDAEDWADAIRWALRIEEANRLGLLVNNNSIYLAGFMGGHADMVVVHQEPDGLVLADNRNETKRTLLDSESLADVLKAVEAEA